MAFKEFIKKFTYEKRTEYLALYSVIINAISAVVKIGLAYVFIDSGGGFFAVSGAVNIFILLAKMTCYKGAKNKEDFQKRTFWVFLFLLISGVIYCVYMSRLFFFETMHIDYPQTLAIILAVVAFIEIIFSTRGLFTVRGRGHFYRYIKLINFCGALLALVLAQVSLLTMTESKNANIADGAFGITVGAIVILVAVFILLSHKISLVDRGKRCYFSDKPVEIDEKIYLTNNKIYGRCYFEYVISDDGMLRGTIKREENIYRRMKWYYKLIVILFFVILFIPYLIGAMVYYFVCGHTPVKLDKYMKAHGYDYIREEVQLLD